MTGQSRWDVLECPSVLHLGP